MNLPLIKVVGVSGSGKSTLVRGLRQAGYNARPISQEHSHVRDLWKQFERARLLIYLDTDLEAQRRRRPDVSWSQAMLNEEKELLEDAKANADLHINTAQMEPEVVLKVALSLLQNHKIARSDTPLPPINATGSALPSAAPVADELPPPQTPTRKHKKRRTT